MNKSTRRTLISLNELAAEPSGGKWHAETIKVKIRKRYPEKFASAESAGALDCIASLVRHAVVRLGL